MALDLLVITAAVLGLITTGLGFPFLLVTELGNILFVIGGAGAIAAGGVAVLAAILTLAIAFGVTIPIMT
jgi:hypothetical protein